MNPTRPRPRRGERFGTAHIAVILFLLLVSPLTAANATSTGGTPGEATNEAPRALWLVDLVEQVLDALDDVVSLVDSATLDDGPALDDEDDTPDEAGPEIEPGG